MLSDEILRRQKADIKNEILAFNEQLLQLSRDSVEYIAVSTAIIALRIRLTEITNERIRRSNFLS
ncbi:hypothetical protein SAMN05216464_1288 [Mucilaginibacter pineti]|uniref:Uncharacterized protein n=2 Tax=Mucilaginibacter pineti TaxID=1391627 RepID=A0A1G7NLA6_9SPHI|nr:hypothetical protein SAMN05216464_1288 [Mucilaginibacter pineti]